jgi:flagellar biosynthesis/type III secretory pathway M-ring protein FliF/YscJ
MDMLKAQLDRIKQQLAGLTASQRMLVGALVAVMALTLLYWGRYASSPEMVPVLNQSLSDDEIGRIDTALEAKGVPHSVVGGKVMVPADRKMEILADLMYRQAMPRDSRSAFEEMSAKLNPFSPESEREAWYNQATQQTLSQLISRFPGVADARVIINAKNEHRIENSIPPSATIFITTRDRESAGKQLVIAAADGVAGAVSGLTPGRISVIINGISHRVPDGDSNSFSGDEIDDVKQRSESRLEQKIRDQFAYIQGLTVTVAVDVENSTIVQHKHTYDAANTLVKPAEEENRTEENTSPSGPAADPGAGANTGASIMTAAASGGGQTSNVDETKSKNMILPSDLLVDTQTPAGKDTVQSAAVRVPRSYFSAIYKQRNPTAKDPDDAALQPIIDAELANIKDGVKKCIGLKTDDQLSVDWYPDTSPVLAMATTTSVPTASITTVTGHVKEISIGLLAVVSLFMMFSMVRKATPAPVVAVAVETKEPPQILTANEGLAGEVGMGGTMLDGVELDEDAIRNQQMLDQVTTMVKENPEGAASLVKRWLNRS